MKAGLSHSEVQTTVLAPQLRHGLRFLAMSLPELRGELFAEMARNPVIDDVESALEKTTISQKEAECAAAAPAPDYPDGDDDALDAARLAGLSRPDDYVIGGRYDGRVVPDADAIERRQKLFDSAAGRETLANHLLAQVASAGFSDDERTLAELLVGELDEDGRLPPGEMEEALSVTGASEGQALAVLRRIRAFDPPGCGARTLAECLEAQLDRVEDAALRGRVAALLGRLDDVARGLVDDAEALRALRSLDPRPGRLFGRSDGGGFVNPEVSAVRGADGRWTARVDARSLPEIRISARYVAMLSDPSASDETKAYVRERIAAAKAVVAAVAKRRETVERIAQEIVDRQPEFFERGLAGLRPLSLQEIADAVGVHATTVSRTVTGKFMATPRGVVELRRLFARAVASDDGEAVARDGVVERIRTLVAEEDPASPLSDARISEVLKADGYSVARRTVAKYRALAGVPGASARRRRR